MKLRLLRVVGLLIGLLFSVMSAPLHAASAASTLPQTVQNIKRSLVGIGTFQALRRPPVDLNGSGFVVHDGLHVVTNYHVVPKGVDSSSQERIIVIVGNGRNYTDRPAKIVAIDAEHDLALLEIQGEPLPAVRLGKGGMMPEGTSVGLTGYPIGSILGVYPVTHTGIVAAITPIKIPLADSRFLDAEMILRSPFDVYQLDATAFPGNSGSPVYNIETGRVEAILNSTFVKETKERALTDPTGISFAIPVVYVHQLMKKAGL